MFAMKNFWIRHNHDIIYVLYFVKVSEWYVHVICLLYVHMFPVGVCVLCLPRVPPVPRLPPSSWPLRSSALTRKDLAAARAPATRQADSVTVSQTHSERQAGGPKQRHNFAQRRRRQTEADEGGTLCTATYCTMHTGRKGNKKQKQNTENVDTTKKHRIYRHFKHHKRSITHPTTISGTSRRLETHILASIWGSIIQR